MSETVGNVLKELSENMKRPNQRLASVEQDARQPRLAMEADVTADKKIRHARRAPLLQFMRSMGIAVPQKRSKPA